MSLSQPPRDFELFQEFWFDAAHRLERTVDVEPGRRIHGHTYHAEVHVRGERDPATGFVIDLGLLRAGIADVRDRLDHRFLDEVPELGTPTLENLCLYIWKSLAPQFPALSRVRVFRKSIGDSCCLQRS